MSGATAEHGSAERDDSSLVESRDRQLQVWRMTLRARYAAILAVSIAALLPIAGRHGRWIALALLVVVMPYNYLYDWVMRRTGTLSPIIAFSDQVITVAILAFAPELVAPILLVMLAINATSAVAFGRRIAAEGAVVGCIGVAGVLWVKDPAHGWATFLVYMLASAFIIAVVGGIAGVEREVRARYIDLMGGIDAIVWEQLTHKPTTLYVNRRAEDIIGYPAESWAQPHFWESHVHPDDREWVAERYQTAVKSGQNCEVEYRFIRPDGSIVWIHDRMHFEHGAGNAARV